MRGILPLQALRESAHVTLTLSDCVGDFVGLPDCDGDSTIMFA